MVTPATSPTATMATSPITTITSGGDGGHAKMTASHRRKLATPKTAKMFDRHFVKHNYHDRSNEVEEDEEDEDHQYEDVMMPQDDKRHNRRSSPGSCSASTSNVGCKPSFPMRLHQVLHQVEHDGLADCISWQPHGRCFVIHKPQKFTEQVMPRYFDQTKLTSFQRQLNLYGFVRLTRGPDAHGYYHEYFLRGKPFLTKHIARTRVKGTKVKGASSPESEPDFYGMPPVHRPSSSSRQVVLSDEEDHASSSSTMCSSQEQQTPFYPNENRLYSFPQQEGAPEFAAATRGAYPNSSSTSTRNTSTSTTNTTPSANRLAKQQQQSRPYVLPSAFLVTDSSSPSRLDDGSGSKMLWKMPPSPAPVNSGHGGTTTTTTIFHDNAGAPLLDPVDALLLELQLEYPQDDPLHSPFFGFGHKNASHAAVPQHQQQQQQQQRINHNHNHLEDFEELSNVFEHQLDNDDFLCRKLSQIVQESFF